MTERYLTSVEVIVTRTSDRKISDVCVSQSDRGTNDRKISDVCVSDCDRNQ